MSYHGPGPNFVSACDLRGPGHPSASQAVADLLQHMPTKSGQKCDRLRAIEYVTCPSVATAGAAMPLTSCGLHCISRSALQPPTGSCIGTPFGLLIPQSEATLKYCELFLLSIRHLVMILLRTRSWVQMSVERFLLREGVPRG